ncbi:uncharacterized protein LOC142233946 [Haematobia irritans]|uniref:uncharacterized protein LOC142233946 n=1 Tax=Haematobia irritans TaxID=7368 RepID=UPI003F5015F7
MSGIWSGPGYRKQIFGRNFEALSIYILVCLALANAEKLGYNYSSGRSHNGFGNRFKHRGITATPAPTPAPTHSNQGVATGANNGLGGFPADAVNGEQYQSLVPQTEFNKEFYSYTAPEDAFNDIEGAERAAAAMRKNLRIVFIRAPENNALTNAALQLAKQSAESKTAIYVLSKQTDVGELADKLQSAQQGHAEKPEVHFVKYRTHEDAIRAQQIIQQEYDSLGGTSRYSNEGVAPVLDFASINEGLLGPRNTQNSVNDLGAPAPTNNGYLPPKIRL